MAIISEQPYEESVGGTDSGGDSLNFTPEHRYTAAVDTPKGGDPAGAQDAVAEVKETGSTQSQAARHGASWALQDGVLKGDTMPFTGSVGIFTPGHDVRDAFESALRDSGGVRQGSSWVSDPAPGAARVIVEHTVTLDQLHKQDEGSGRTFETQRHSHWTHDRWGG